MAAGGSPFDLSSAGNRLLLEPVNKRFDELHAIAYPADKPKDDELRGVPEREAVSIRSDRGMLTGLRERGDVEGAGYPEERGLLADSLDAENPYAARHLCCGCVKSLNKGKLPPEALVNGTWQGLVPAVLKDLTDIERQTLSIYNVVQFIKPMLGAVPRTRMPPSQHPQENAVALPPTTF